MSRTWSKPHYGVSHLDHPRDGYQVTCDDRGSFVEVYVLALHGDHPFTPIWEEMFPDVATARAAAEQQYDMVTGASRKG